MDSFRSAMGGNTYSSLMFTVFGVVENKIVYIMSAECNFNTFGLKSGIMCKAKPVDSTNRFLGETQFLPILRAKTIL